MPALLRSARAAALAPRAGHPGEPNAPLTLAALAGASAAMQELRARVARVIPTGVTVLIEGETGTGKELLARVVHHQGPRAGGPFVPVNCGALSPELVDAELFGHERGAFTGAVTRRPGRAAEADGGTLFLDEIGELAASAQCKLLRLLQQGEVQRVGRDRPLGVDVRIVAATNRDLRGLVASGAFRADCYYRLAAVTVRVPPLRARADDVVLLAERLVVRFAAELGRPAPALDAAAAAALRAHSWPGNVRELENVIREAVLYCDGPVLDTRAVRAVLGGVPARSAPPSAAALEALLDACDGNVTRAARELGMSRPTLYERMRQLSVDYARHRRRARAGGPAPADEPPR